MKNTHIIEVCQQYDEMLLEQGFIVEHRKQHDDYNMDHIRWMLNEIPKLLDDPLKTDKANRWLGFVQGIMCARGYFSIDEMKSHNRSGENPMNVIPPQEQHFWYEGGIKEIEHD